MDTLPSASPPKDDRRGLDFNQLAVRAAGRTSAGVPPASHSAMPRDTNLRAKSTRPVHVSNE